MEGRFITEFTSWGFGVRGVLSASFLGGESRCSHPQQVMDHSSKSWITPLILASFVSGIAQGDSQRIIRVEGIHWNGMGSCSSLRLLQVERCYFS